MVTQADTRHMAQALSLASRGLGNCWPNPAVGCVIVKDKRIIGRGWTQPGGRPHAETRALAQAGARARGATVYVTMEPCAHHGQTPPCAEALIKAEVARVVTALTDPDQRVSGKGHALLRQAGIQVSEGVMEQQAAVLNRGFLLRVREGRPLVTLKLATSFDGRIATASGESQWITGPQSRRRVHMMRAQHDAVMVGAGTARADDPSLTVRDLGIRHQPVRVVCSRNLDIPLTTNLARTAEEVPLWLCHGPDAPGELCQAWQNLGARLFEIPLGADGMLETSSLFRALADAGITRVFCEGGAALAGALLSAGLVDELVGFTAGMTLGGDGWPAVVPMRLEKLENAPRFHPVETTRVGEDVMHRWVRSGQVP